MNEGDRGRVTWYDALTRRFSGSRNGRSAISLSEAAVRNALVARVRWLLLVFIGGYILTAGSVFLFSKYGLFLNTEQKTVLLISVLSVFFYNLVYQFRYETIGSFRFADHLQILLDILFVTALIHVSGGVSSWFWPVYLVVTIEAAFLLERQGEVWLIGAIGGSFYGALLAVEYFGQVNYVRMPFVEQTLHHDYLYIILRWLWAVILNTVTAIVTTFLMGVIRTEAQLLMADAAIRAGYLTKAEALIAPIASNDGYYYLLKAQLRYKQEQYPLYTFSVQRPVSGPAVSWRPVLPGNSSMPDDTPDCHR